MLLVLVLLAKCLLWLVLPSQSYYVVLTQSIHGKHIKNTSRNKNKNVSFCDSAGNCKPTLYSHAYGSRSLQVYIFFIFLLFFSPFFFFFLFLSPKLSLFLQSLVILQNLTYLCHYSVVNTALTEQFCYLYNQICAKLLHTNIRHLRKLNSKCLVWFSSVHWSQWLFD